MQNLLLACSPRRGNTDALCAATAKRLFDCETVYLRDFSIAPCDGCGACALSGVCKNGDDVDKLYRKLLSARNIYFFAPVYFCGFDAHTKAFLDRGQFLWAKRDARRERNYYLIACGGQRTKDNFDGLTATLRAHAYTVGARYRDGLLLRGVDAVGDLTETHFDALTRFLSEAEQTR